LEEGKDEDDDKAEERSGDFTIEEKTKKRV